MKRYNSRRKDYTGWRRGPKGRSPAAHVVVDKRHVTMPHFMVFEDWILGSDFRRATLSRCAPCDLFYTWLQFYNAHEHNRREYLWVMGGLHG
jgi:hypothetical protein